MINSKISFNFTTALLDPRITFSRANATATCVNSAGYLEIVAANTPRFNYDPVTLVCKGLLIEEQRTNLVATSKDYSIGWVQNGSFTPVTNNFAPDGTNTAYSWSSVSGNDGYYRVISVSGSTTYTFSVYVKKLGGFGGILFGAENAAFTGNQPAYFIFNPETLSFSDIPESVSAYGYEYAANGWYRIWLTSTTISAATSIVYILYVRNTLNLAVYGSQLESGEFMTSHIPTSGTVLTRNADVATITGSNFTGFWNSVQGGAQVQSTPFTVSGVRPLVQFDDNTANEIIALRGNTTNPELYIVDGGTPQAQLDAGTIAANTAYSLTGWWATNDCKARQDAGSVVTDTTANIPTVTQMRIGSDGTNYLNGTIATIGYYDSFFGRPIYTRRKNKVFASLL
jgi:predicted secreted protein